MGDCKVPAGPTLDFQDFLENQMRNLSGVCPGFPNVLKKSASHPVEDGRDEGGTRGSGRHSVGPARGSVRHLKGRPPLVLAAPLRTALDSWRSDEPITEVEFFQSLIPWE